ncbi:MerR family transcriptional regulator [Jiangella anatolica]|uniref:MerR family transcriptional regulator n=1 Tax=Jiangella anatolica TaxID=2670374 RepID=A0A2W2BLX5_9ACTN|nr:MerR family transcriptional regulator [Jiangella anatolica]PZF81288.1 MerR family transcriptional regulator [Jiangella anatolica]
MTLRSGELAAAAGVNLQTLRYYERRGLLAAPERTLGGHRVYDDDTLTTVRIIKAAQRLGFTLDEIADLVDTGRGHARDDADLRAKAAAKIAEIESRIAALETIRDTLRAAVDAGCHDLRDCAGSPGCPIPFPDLADD